MINFLTALVMLASLASCSGGGAKFGAFDYEKEAEIKDISFDIVRDVKINYCTQYIDEFKGKWLVGKDVNTPDFLVLKQTDPKKAAELEEHVKATAFKEYIKKIKSDPNFVNDSLFKGKTMVLLGQYNRANKSFYIDGLYPNTAFSFSRLIRNNNSTNTINNAIFNAFYTDDSDEKTFSDSQKAKKTIEYIGNGETHLRTEVEYKNTYNLILDKDLYKGTPVSLEKRKLFMKFSPAITDIIIRDQVMGNKINITLNYIVADPRCELRKGVPRVYFNAVEMQAFDAGGGELFHWRKKGGSKFYITAKTSD